MENQVLNRKYLPRSVHATHDGGCERKLSEDVTSGI